MEGDYTRISRREGVQVPEIGPGLYDRKRERESEKERERERERVRERETARERKR